PVQASALRHPVEVGRSLPGGQNRPAAQSTITGLSVMPALRSAQPAHGLPIPTNEKRIAVKFFGLGKKSAVGVQRRLGGCGQEHNSKAVNTALRIRGFSWYGEISEADQEVVFRN